MTMNRDTLKLVIALAAMALAGGAWLNDRPVPHLPGVLAPEEPEQGTPADDRPWQYLGYEIRPRATYALRARVLSATRYRWDRGARLAPVDLAVGWGVMSDSTWLERFKITQGARFYTLYPRDAGVDLSEALLHSANMHLIPATPDVRRALEAAREGSLVSVRGRLVDVAGPDGFTWQSSLRRDDTGAGACELIWVDEITLQ
jgi:hypothetical protein